jgi:hypothetical protein
VQRRDAAAAQPDHLDAIDLKMIEQRDHDDRGLLERVGGTGPCRPPVTAQVRRDQPVPGGRFPEDEFPIRAVAHPAVEPEQRFAIAMNVVVQLHAADVDHHRRDYGGMPRTAPVWPRIVDIMETSPQHWSAIGGSQSTHGGIRAVELGGSVTVVPWHCWQPDAISVCCFSRSI